MLHWVDLTLIVIYLAATVIVGIASRGRQEDASDYFTGQGLFSGWFGSLLVGLSIAATLFSGISLLSYPAVIYGGGTELLLALPLFAVMWAILTFWFLPRYLQGRSRHPYEVLEQRFGRRTRTVAAMMFVMLRIGWMAALIYAPTVAVMAAGRLSDAWFWPLVLAIGISSTIYTTVGGIRGVIVTDAIQFLIIAGGIAATIVYVMLRLPVPVSTAIADLRASGHLGNLDTSLDLTRPLTVWAVLCGGLIGNLGSYIGDQMSLQRYLALGTPRAASQSFLVNIIGVVVVLLMLGVVGLCLVSWYQHVPDGNRPITADKIFPYFVATQLPVGAAGLILAAILAATMSSMTSGINALASTITLDFRMSFGAAMGPRAQLSFARRASLVVGILATFMAGFVGAMGSIFDISQTLLGVFLGPLLACVILAVARVAVRGHAVIAGMVAGTLAGWAVTFSPITSLWVAPLAFGSSLLATGIGHLFARGVSSFASQEVAG